MATEAGCAEHARQPVDVVSPPEQMSDLSKPHRSHGTHIDHALNCSDPEC